MRLALRERTSRTSAARLVCRTSTGNRIVAACSRKAESVSEASAHEPAKLGQNLTAFAHAVRGHTFGSNLVRPGPDGGDANFEQSQDVVGKRSQCYGSKTDRFEFLAKRW